MRSTKISLLGTRIGDYTIRFLPGIEADHAPGYTTVDFRRGKIRCQENPRMREKRGVLIPGTLSALLAAYPPFVPLRKGHGYGGGC